MSSSHKGAFDAGVFSSLTDFGFERFATPKLIRILYILGLIVLLLYGIGFLVAGLAQGGGMAFLTLIGVPVGVLLSLLYLRVTMELLAVLFRVGQNTSRMVELAEAGVAPAGAGPARGPGPGPGPGHGAPPNPPGAGGPPGPEGFGGPSSPPPSPSS